MSNLNQKSTDNPKLLKKELTNGTYSLYLQYYLGYTKTINEKTGNELIVKDRRKETLNLYLLDNSEHTHPLISLKYPAKGIHFFV